jgi:hypothetical protein
MINAATCKRQAGFEVIRFQVGHLIENLSGVETGGEEVKNVAHANAHPTYARTATALLWITGDTVKQVGHD